LWLLNLNPVDYKIWSLIQQRVYHTKVQDVSDLKQRLIDVWAVRGMELLDNAIDQL